jgi:imidazolonepropionase-like amidohydrolase
MVKGVEHSFKRYAIEGVMWGRETVWFDSNENLIALVGADAELDRFEAVKEGFEDALPFFVQKAAEDALKHLRDLSKRIKPVISGKYAIVGGLLIGGKGFKTIPDSVIFIEKGKITAVGSRLETALPKGIRVIDAKGKTILPGLFDMHAHATQAEWFPASLAAGITTMRDAANEMEFIAPIRDAVNSGEITVSPRLLLAGYIDSGENSVGSMKAETPAEARAIVNRYKQAGYQQIKIYQSLKPELVKVVTDQAHKLSMTVTGHIPTGHNIFTAVDNGFDQVNHLGFVARVMTPRDFDSKSGGKRNFDPTNKLAKDGFRFFLDNNIVVEPTLARGENSSKILGDSYEDTEPGAKKLPFEFASLIKSMGVPSEMALRRQRGRAFGLRLLKAVYDAGIPLIVGTDLVIPGHTEYREIELFVKAGIPVIDAIKAATIVPAKAMNLENELGTIEPGKRADLILLDRNPLDEISNIRTVKFVVKDGLMFETAPLWKSVNFRP